MNLTPAEAMVLLEPDQENGIAAAKVTLLALLAEGVLKQEEIPGRFGTLTRLAVVRPPAENPPHVAAVLDAVRASKTGVVQDVASILSKATRGFVTFVSGLVRPRLVLRGLLTEHRHQEQRRVLLFFRRTVTVTTWHLTEAGAREQVRLRGLMAEAPGIATMLDEDPGRAAAMAASLGVLILLVPSLLPFLGQIASAMALHHPTNISDSGGDFSWTSSADAVSAGVGGLFDSAVSDSASDSSSGSSSDSSSDSASDSGGSDSGGGSE